MFLNKLFRLFLIVLFFTWTSAILRCGLIQQEPNKSYYRVKKCFRRNTSLIARLNTNSFTKCLNYAIEKKGLAFNFSPNKDVTEEDFFFSSCEILGCPDVDNLTSLVNDSRFDYYTLYGNTEDLINSSCIPSIGVFRLNWESENYTKAENICRTIGSELADILTEARTNGLAEILEKNNVDWYKSAYVGLNDIRMEGSFLTSRNEPLECFRFRAWAPGHPRNKRKYDDCVIIDSERTWKAINCRNKLPFFCEIAPKPPFWKEMNEFQNTSCSSILKRLIRRRCKKIKKKFKKAKKPINYEDEMELEDRCEEN